MSEVIRITCNDKEIRKEYNIEDLSKLSNVDLEFSLLFDNVRGFVTKSKFNKNILKTLEEKPTRFFIYNNGLTLTAKNIESNDYPIKKLKLRLEGIQVLNGGQTLRTIHNFNKQDKKNVVNNLTEAQVSLRIFKTSSDNDLNNKIAEFTNSQNAISNIDLKSLRSEQLQLEQYLSEYKIMYVRKSGDSGLKEEINYEYRISMEKFGQILFSLKGFPQKAINQKKNIFDKYYNDVFGEDVFKIESTPEQIKKYFKIKEEYKKIVKDVSDQKIFYILHLDKELKDRDLKKIINEFEKIIKEFKTDKEISDARKLIRNDFKAFVDEKFNLNNED